MPSFTGERISAVSQPDGGSPHRVDQEHQDPREHFVREVPLVEILDFAKHQVRQLVECAPYQFPAYSKSGKWVTTDRWAPSWTGGFLTGLMWLFARHSDDDWWRRTADAYCFELEPRRCDATTHDLGFIFDPSWGRRHQEYGDERSREVLIDAGRTMAQRMQPGGYLCSWVDPGNTFIDIMMNVGIVFEASRLSDDDALRDVAIRHCLTTQRYLVRGDGSTIHEGWFDPDSGEFLRASTHQGWRPDSSWARGQAWAIYGFADAYRYTNESKFLATACTAADYFIEMTPGFLAPNDWCEVDPTIPVEASANATAASALLTLADLVPPGVQAQRYRSFALSSLKLLMSTEYVAVDRPGWEGILLHSIYNSPEGLGVDESVMWGDYYFVEALTKAMELPVDSDRHPQFVASGIHHDK